MEKRDGKERDDMRKDGRYRGAGDIGGGDRREGMRRIESGGEQPYIEGTLLGNMLTKRKQNAQ